MPYSAPKTIADRVAHARTNTVPEGAGNMILAPSQYVKNWGFFDVDANGDPEDFELRLPEPYDGRMVYFSAKDRGASTLAAQTVSPVPATQPSWVASQPWIAGPPPPSQVLQANLVQPAQPTIQLVASGIHGYDAGDYDLAWTRVDSKGRHTPPSPGIVVTVPTNGYSIRITPPAGPHQGDTVGIGIWMGTKNGNYSSISLQTVINIVSGVPSTYLLSGPYRFGLKPAGFKYASMERLASPYVFKEPGEYTLPAGSYQFSVHYVDQYGNFTFRSYPSKVYTISTPEPKTRFRFFPSRYPSWAVGWRGTVFIRRPPATGAVQAFIAYSTEWGDPTRTLPIKPGATLQQIQISNYQIIGGGAFCYGYIGDENLSAQWQLDPAPFYLDMAGPGTVSLTPIGDPNSDNPDILELPDSPLEDPTVEGTQVITPGKYWVTIANTARGRIGPPATPKQVTVNSGQVPRVLFPRATNYFPNAEGIEVDRTGSPYDHGITPGSGSISVGGGYVTLNTSGTLTTGQPKHTLTSEALSTTLTYHLEISAEISWSVGVFNVYVEQLDASGAVGSRQLLANYQTSGLFLISATLRPATGSETAGTMYAGNVITFIDGLYQVRLSNEMSGASMNMLVRLSEMSLSDDEIGKPRRRVSPPADTFGPADTNPSKDTPLPVTTDRAVEAPPLPGSYSPAALNVFSRVGFETGVLPADWTVTQSPATGTTLAAATAAAINGTYGLRVAKTVSSQAYLFLSKQFGTEARERLAFRFRYRHLAPLPSGPRLAVFTNDLATSASYIESERMAYIYIVNNTVYAKTYNPASGYSQVAAMATLRVGDACDFELIAIKPASNGTGNMQVWLGRNGATRTLLGTVGGLYGWQGRSPRAVSIGVLGENTSSSFTLDYDDFVVTAAGDTDQTTVPSPPPATAIPQPDRPSKAGTILDTTDFEGNSIPAAWSQTTTGTGMTLAVQTGSAISGTYGLRVADANTTTSSTAYIERTIPGGARTEVGCAASFRLVGLPSSGSANIFGIGESGGTQTVLGTLDSTGKLYVQGFKAGGASVTSQQQVNTSTLSAGTVITVEAVPSGTGTAAGGFSCYVTIGSAQRQLMFQASALDWSSSQALTTRVGIWGQSVNSSTTTLDIDNVITTEAGTVVLRETSSDGRVINQAHMWLEGGTPAQPNVFLLTKTPLSVVPGDTYTGCIQSRISVRPNPVDSVLPYYMVAYRNDGAKVELGSLAGAGLYASTPWVEYRASFTIPDDCYEVVMESRNILAGEYVAQEFVWVDGSPSGEITPDQSFATDGSFSVVFDRESPHGRLFSGIGVRHTRIATVIDLPDNTSATVNYRATNDGTFGTWSSYVTDPTLVPDYRFSEVLIEMSGDGSTTPTVLAGSPIYEYALYGTTTQPFATLLREDGSELLGGVALADFSFDRNISDWDIRKVRTGRSVAFRLSPTVAIYPDFKILAATVDAMREIEENCLAKPFMVEARGRRALVRFTQQLKFEEKPHTYRLYDFEETAIEQMYGEAKVGRVEILEISDMAV